MKNTGKTRDINLILQENFKKLRKETMYSLVYNIKLKKQNCTCFLVRVLSFLIFSSSLVFLSSCQDKKNFISNHRTSLDPQVPEINNPTGKQTDTPDTDTDTPSESSWGLKDVDIIFENLLSNETSPVIRVSGLKESASIHLLEGEGGCQGAEEISSRNSDGVFEGISPSSEYQDRQFYIKLNYQGQSECQPAQYSWVHLQAPSLSLNEEETNLDKRYPKFNASNLFLGKNTQLSLHEDELCQTPSVSELVNTNNATAIIGISTSLSDTDTHTYWVKQSYKGVASCSSLGVDYSYSIDLDNLGLSYDDVLFGSSPSGVSVTRILPSASVSLHKGSCESEPDSTLDSDGTLYPQAVDYYEESLLYIKYTRLEQSDCSLMDTKYLYLQTPVLSLNEASTALNKRRPVFDVTNLFTGKHVTVSLHEDFSCLSDSVSSPVQTDTGSASLTLSLDLNDNLTHSYYVKQSYLGHSSCSNAVEYTYGLSISDLTITSDPVLYGNNPSSISVEGMIEGSTVSIHKGSCNADADDSISSDGTLTPVSVNTYIESDIYLKYSLSGGSTCSSIGVKYINLETPVLTLNSEQTNLDKRSPKFNAQGLFAGKEVSLTLHSDSSCLTASLSSPVVSSSGSALITPSSLLSDTSSHSYYLKQSYLGVSSCSLVLNYKYDLLISNLALSYDTVIDGAEPSNIGVTKILSGATVSLHKGSCGAVADDSINADGSLTPSLINSYTETDIYLKYSRLEESDCIKLDTKYIRLLTPSVSLNEIETNLDKRTPVFNVSNLFTGKNVSVSLHTDSSCSSESVSSLVQTDSGSEVISPSQALTDNLTHSYWVKQSYGGVSSCSSQTQYGYEIDVDSLGLSYDAILYGVLPGSVTVSKMLSGSTVSLHKDSCLSDPEATISQDGTLTPSASNTYQESDLYINYTFDEDSDCKQISSKYLNLIPGSLSLNSAETALHKRTPSFNASNLFSSKLVTVALYDNSTCTGDPVSAQTQTDTGSTLLTISSDINDNDTHSYYLKQSYLGYSTCSVSVQYTYGLSISDLTITSDPILYSSTPSSISVSGMITDSTVSIHKGSCGASADDTISSDGTLTPQAVGSYIESDIYLKYSLNGASSCDLIGVKYLNLENPVLSLNVAQTNLDRRSPKFNATNLFSGKEVSLTLHESADCSGAAVSTTVNSDTGSDVLGLTSILTDINSHTYSVKQSYLGYSTCSNVLAYQYEIDTSALGISADEILYGTTPGNVTVSKMISGSTVSLHKGSCGAVADDSINADGTLTPTSTGSYNYSQIYIKYTKGGSSDCDPIDSHYLYLEQPTLSLNSAQTTAHPLTPTFNVTNLFTGQSVTAQLYEDSSCSASAVSTSSVTDTGSTSLTLSSALEDSDSHSYYVKQSFSGQSTCSEALAYQFSADSSDLTLTYDPVLYGSTPAGVAVSGMVSGSSVSLYKGNNCLGVADATINADGTIYPTATNSYTESDIYLKYSFDESSSCIKLDTSYIYLESSTITLATPLTDARIPSYNVTGLFNGKSVTVTLHESSDCSGAAVSSNMVSATGSAVVAKSSALTDLSSHSFSVKQSYSGVTSCSNSLSYTYSIDTANLGIAADSILYGATPSSVTISKMIAGSTVSLHKGSCGAAADASINADGTLTPTSTGSYNYSQLYIKYTKGGNTDCDPISSHYLYLERPTLVLNSAQTDTHPLTPTFNISNLFTGQSVTAQLYEDSSCSMSAVSTSSSSSTGSTTLTLSSAINDNLVHTYYVKQSFEGNSTCSQTGQEYSISVDTSDLTITTEPSNGVVDITVTGGLVGSTISVHRGSCNGTQWDSGSFSAVNEEMYLMYAPDDISVSTEEDIYLKYSFNGDSDCLVLDQKFIYLSQPTSSLNTPLSDARIPSFNVSNLFSGKSVTLTLHETNNCSGAAVSSNVVSATGSATITRSSALTDINSHFYSVKESYGGVSVCSNYINYTYSIDVDNLVVSSDSVLFGSTPGSVSVSNILSGSTVSLHKGSCLASSEASISSDGTLTPTSSGSYQEVDLYLKYTFNESSDCKSISSKYLYLEQPAVSLDSASTLLHPTTPTFNITNLYSGKSVAITLHSLPDCSDSAISSPVVSSTGSGSLTQSSAISTNGGYSYYVKQSYLGFSSCSEEEFYIYRDQPIEYLSTMQEYNKSYLTYSVNKNKGIMIKNTEFNNRVKVYEGSDCSNEGNLITTVTTVKDITEVEIPDLEDGTHQFSFQEQNPSLRNLGCYTTGSISVKNATTVGNYNRFAKISSNTLSFYGQYDYSKTFTAAKAPVAVFPAGITGGSAFAVLHKDGSVTGWGPGPLFGEDTSSVESSLDGSIPVRKIYATGSAFAALRSDGSVITWGNNSNGGNSSTVSSSVSSGVIKIVGTLYSFAALRNDGSVVAWGNASYGGSASSVASNLTGGVVDVVATQRAFAALKSDGSVVTWGDATYGGNSSSVASSISSGVVKVYANTYSYAALKSNGSVVTWGDSTNGGNSSSVSSSLSSGVVRLYPGEKTWAALKSNGSVVTWGDATYGGDSSSVAASLTSGVVDIYVNSMAFIAVKSDGSLVSWGQAAYGADLSTVGPLITGNLVRIYSNARAFAALLTDGSVVSWGDDNYGGRLLTASSSVDGTIDVVDIVSTNWSFMALREDGSTVIWGSLLNHKPYRQPDWASTDKVYSNNYSFAVLKANGSVNVWGDFSYGGWPSASIQSALSSGVTDIFTNKYAYAALKSDGSLVVWGVGSYGGDSSSVSSQISSGVTSVYGTDRAFAALKSDGSVVAWGAETYGGDCSSVSSSLTSGVVSITPNQYAFAALKSNGSVVTWGNSSYGGDSSSVSTQLSSGVVSVIATLRAFAALKSDGSVVSWGDSSYGGNSSSVSTQLSSGVSSVYANEAAYAVLKTDGSVVTWGAAGYGGDSSSFASKLSSNVVSVYASDRAFVAIKTDGSIVGWGSSSYGGSISSVAAAIKSKGISKIITNGNAFVALLQDGSVVSWGSATRGGNSSAVASALASGVDDIFVSDTAGYALKSGVLISWGLTPPDFNLLDSSSIDGTYPVSKLFSTKNFMMIIHTDNSISYVE